MTFAINGKTSGGDSITAAFIHIPRTAGRWTVGACLAAGLEVNQCGAQHEEYNAGMSHMPSGASVFTIGRHPATWLRSWYTSTAVNGWKGWTNPTNALMEYQADTFAEFVANIRPGHIDDIWGQYIGEGLTVLAHESIDRALVDFLDFEGFAYNRDALKAFDSGQFKSRHKDELTTDVCAAIKEKAPYLYLLFGYEVMP